MKHIQLFEQFIQTQALNELNLKTYDNIVESRKSEKLARERIKRGDAEEVKDKGKTIFKIALPKGAIEYRNKQGQLHRKSGFAKKWANGDEQWFLNGKLHREDGPAVTRGDGSYLWYQNGELHREDGPAVKFPSGSEHWYLNGKRHREDGPAIDSPGYDKWYLNGKELTQDEFERKMNKK